jgi:hypothetical protein
MGGGEGGEELKTDKRYNGYFVTPDVMSFLCHLATLCVCVCVCVCVCESAIGRMVANIPAGDSMVSLK